MSGYGNNPLGNPSDEMRLYLGDTDRCDPVLTDPEVAYYLARNNGDPLLSALAAARNLVMRYSRAVDESVGPVSISWSQRYTQMMQTVSYLEARSDTYSPVVWAGGVSVSDVRGIEADPDRVRPMFQRGSLDDPRTCAGDRPRSELGPCDYDPTIEGSEPC